MSTISITDYSIIHKSAITLWFQPEIQDATQLQELTRLFGPYAYYYYPLNNIIYATLKNKDTILPPNEQGIKKLEAGDKNNQLRSYHQLPPYTYTY